MTTVAVVAVTLVAYFMGWKRGYATGHKDGQGSPWWDR